MSRLRYSAELINECISYLLVLLLWAPHGARECIEICNGPYFISPMIGTFLMPNWTMDMSLKGWALQLLFAPPLLLLLYMLYRLQTKKYWTILKIYGVRWLIMWFGILVYYNAIFWSASIREYMLPLFTFTVS